WSSHHADMLLSNYIFFFNDPAPTQIYTLSLHDALPISSWSSTPRPSGAICSRCTTAALRMPGTMPRAWSCCARSAWPPRTSQGRSEEHTSELQSRENLVCRLLLEKKKK